MQKVKKERRKRIIVEVDDLFHQEIKRRAVFRGQTISHWVITAINERIQEEKKRE